MDRSESNLPRKRRHSKACTRCRRRKIRCDFQYPACGACQAADATCMGFDSVHGTDKPRSTISHLKDEVARLEIELGRVKSQTSNTLEMTDGVIERLTMGVARAIVEPRGGSRKNESLLPLTSTFFLTGSPVPHLRSQAWEDTNAVQTPENPPRAITISSIPRHIVDIMLKNYCEMYRPRYPAIEESELYEACNRVYNNEQPSDFDCFCTYISLAISTNTLMHQDEKRAKMAASGFWATAMAHLGQIGLVASWERLQALQLLTHYGLLNPEDVDCARCAAAATRLCLQLGLHHELPPLTQMKLDAATLDTRRRLFWNSYSNDSAVNTVRCRPFVWPTSTYTAKFPVSDSKSSPGIHVWLLRQIESEITLTLYYPSLNPKNPIAPASINQWLTSMHERLNEWHQATLQSVNLTEKIEFHELFFHVQMLRLNRPSPRCPNPTREMRKKALKSSIALIKEFSVIDRLGKLFNLWHATYFIVESGICLLASILSGIEPIGQFVTHLEGEDVAILTRYVKIFPFLLWRVSRRWSNVARHAEALEAISLFVLEKLRQWSNGEVIESSDSHALKQKLNQLSLFSPLPFEAQPPAAEPDFAQAISYGYANRVSQLSSPLPIPGMNVSPEAIGHELHLQPNDAAAVVMNSSGAVEESNFLASTIDTASFNAGWIGLQQSPEYNTSLFPDLGVGDVTRWDFPGMDSEEIFGALLEGEDIPLIDDFSVTE